MKPLHSEFVRFQVLVPVHFYFSRREDNSKDSAVVLKRKWRHVRLGWKSHLNLEFLCLVYNKLTKSWNLDPFLGIICVGILGMLGTALPHTHVHLKALRRQPEPSHAHSVLSNSHNKPELLQVHQAPCARAGLLYPHKHSHSLSRTDRYLVSLLKSIYFVYLLIHLPSREGKKRHFSDVKIRVSIMLPTKRKDCFLGAGDKPCVGDSWAEILCFSI